MESELYVRAIRLRRDEVASFDAYPFSIPAIRHLRQLDLAHVTLLVGENGTGKSTLLEATAAAVGLNPEGGSRNFRFSTRASHSHLHQYLTIVRSARFIRDGFFFRAESFFNVASEAERLGVLASYGGRSLHEQSHGESFLALLENRISDGFYVFDEPEAALSPNRQLTALRMIYDRVRTGAQFLIATHSPIMLAYPGARIVELTHQGIRQISLEESEHFRTARDFLAAPSRMLEVLLGQDD